MTKIYTFDVWDTLIKRKCHPEEIKLKLSEWILIKYYSDLLDEYKNIYSILKLRNKIEAELVTKDGECLIDDVLKELILRTTNKKEISLKEVKELVNKEIEIEKEATYVNPDILYYIDKYKDYDKYCISDFYMNSSELKEILKHHDLLKYFKEVYSSADAKLTKRDKGKLFNYFSSKEKIDFKDMTHIGDNEYSDIEIPKKLGIKTIKIERKDRFYFDVNNDKVPKFNLKEIYKEDKFYNLGVSLSPLAFFFIYDLILYFKKKNANFIFFQTREGETFIKLYEEFIKSNPFTFSLPDKSLIEVSRVATFSPSLGSLNYPGLLRMWSQYRSQSPDSFFKTLDLDINKYMKYLDKYFIKADEVIREPWFDIKFTRLLNDENFINDVNKELAIKNKEINKYLDKNILNKINDKNLFLVDIGWRGSIQDNLSYILKDYNIYGYYLALFDRYNYEREGTGKDALLNNHNKNIEIVNSIITVLEFIFNSPSGSVISYKDGKAVRKEIKEESSFNKTYIKPLQEGMKDGIKYISKIMKFHPLSKEIYAPYIYKLLEDIKKNPSNEILELYYKNVHNDFFGAGEVVRKEKLSFKEKLSLRKIKVKYEEEIWKEAFIKTNKVKYFEIILKIYQTVRRKK